MKKEDGDNQTLGYMKAIRRKNATDEALKLAKIKKYGELGEIRDKKSFPSDRWKALKKLILQEIEEIYTDTTWDVDEPAWLLEMTKIQSILQNSNVCNYCGHSFKKGNHSRCGL